MAKRIRKTVSAEFTLNAITGTARTRSLRIAALDHKARDHTVEDHAVVKAFLDRKSVV